MRINTAENPLTLFTKILLITISVTVKSELYREIIYQNQLLLPLRQNPQISTSPFS